MAKVVFINSFSSINIDYLPNINSYKIEPVKHVVGKEHSEICHRHIFQTPNNGGRQSGIVVRTHNHTRVEYETHNTGDPEHGNKMWVRPAIILGCLVI